MPLKVNLLLLLSLFIALAILALVGQYGWRDPLIVVRGKVRRLAAWVLAVFFAVDHLAGTWGNTGAVTCDFACQWLMGRMFREHRAHELYLVEPQYEVLALGYSGDDLKTMNRDVLRKGTRAEVDGIEGPLYPPTDGLYMWPFTAFSPQASHAVLTLIYIQVTFVVGWLVNRITDDRIGIGEGALILLTFPNFTGGILLGQNQALTALLITGGWALWARGWPLLGGLVWGLLAFKPVFAAALIWVPLALLSGRMLLGMIASGAGFCLATLPFCGIGAWQRWWIVGQNAADLYSRDRNWVWMSRDLVGLPRRKMWDAEHLGAHVRYLFGMESWDDKLLQGVQNGFMETMIGWCLLGGVVLLTIGVVALRAWVLRRRHLPAAMPAYGAAPAFLLTGGLLSCFHFMHYDLAPLALPFTLLLAGASTLGRAGRWFLFALAIGIYACSWDILVGLGSLRIPFETYLFLLLWAWTGCLTLLEAYRTPRLTLPYPGHGWSKLQPPDRAPALP